MDSQQARELASFDALGQAELVASGELTAVELLDAAITRLDAARPLNAVITDLFDLGRRQSAALDDSGGLRTGEAGPLAGVPFLLKDLGSSLAGAPEAMGSRALRSHVASETSWTVERYLDAGLVVFGKTNTPEWGNHCTTEPFLFGRTANPWSPDVTPGGSSGGSAAAVAAGVVPAASGGDGTGSIRVPASCCGLVGLKPRRGRSSFAPDGGQGMEGLVNGHALTRTVRDSAALLDVITGSAVGDPYTVPAPDTSFLGAFAQRPAAARILTTTDSPFPGAPTHPEVAAAVESVARTLADLGHAVAEGAPSFDPDVVADAIAVLHAVSNAQLHGFGKQVLGHEPTEDDFEPSSWVMMREGFTTTGVAYAEAIGAVHAQTRRFATGMSGHDVLLVPTLITPPPPYGLLNQPRGTTRAFFDVEFATTGWTTMANVTGWAAISLPLGVTSTGLPIGVQLMAPDELILLQLAAQLEVAMPWSGRLPAGWIG
ncbi:6-aminohexanoate-cyclic-dimer hydrolase [Mycobacterium antarcticum]|uniref:amidase n=1 Tax=unclassified Mycolicibacterium TaxID=2636767 RepID=UPI0023A4C335|nr:MULTISPECIES: amidase family protein [unclassified Mycolicibacterium]BDX31999.1 6-aminohexanoate-cyclic-dimer hydrolase [Mycolicibacterium sp. TUM20985]GLP75303.1 6-aminohexanoate-cyclic-dimer hydrolase [Mycolicibacterium sp. TUM20983]GLP84433.1 6-aminohexanoate-cyclic-dimer hydrolase [Mycolicibacterium sp. TUM20984]